MREREREAGTSRKMRNQEHHNLYSSNIIMVVKSKRMTWAGLVACMEILAYKILVE
jgi:hypothetical protein